MKPKHYIMPYGSPQKLSELIYKERLYTPSGINQRISPETIRKVCKGQIKGVASEELAAVIYQNAHRVGGFKLPNKK